MNYPSNCIKLRELCIPLYTNYLIANKKFPVTKFTPRKKGSGIIYYIKLTIKTNNIVIPSVLSGTSSRYNINNNRNNVLSGANAIYKIGYTSRTITHRLTTMNIKPNINITILATLNFNKLVDAYNMEQVLHKEHSKERYYGERLMESGYSECYRSDVLGLDC
jgi:hypothetical protein